MISKERLEDLIKEGAKIYAIVKKPFIAGYSQILEVEEFDLKAPIVKEISEDGKQFLYFNYILELEYLFETKEEAEFVLNFHTSKTIYFEPPTWEEFLRTEADDTYACWEIQKIAIIMDTESKCFFITNNLSCVWESFSYTDENKKQKYYEAVEYAKKLFLEDK